MFLQTQQPRRGEKMQWSQLMMEYTYSSHTVVLSLQWFGMHRVQHFFLHHMMAVYVHLMLPSKCLRKSLLRMMMMSSTRIRLGIIWTMGTSLGCSAWWVKSLAVSFCAVHIVSLLSLTSHRYHISDINQELDHRYGSDGKCFFLSTSEGSVMHVDLRSNGKLTFDQTLSEKKINSVRYVSISFQCLTLTRISVSRISVYFLFLINLAVFTPTVM